MISGKKADEGPFNGLATLSIARQNSNYGSHNKKCISVNDHRIEKITGTFKNDVLEVGQFEF